MAITAKIEQETKKEISFPCLMRSKTSGLVVLFTAEKSGTALTTSAGWTVGDSFGDFISCADSEQWEPSPPIMLSNS